MGRGLAAKGKQVVFEKFGFAEGDGVTHHRDRPIYGLDGFRTSVTLGERQSPEVNDWRMRYDPTVETLDTADLYGHWQSDKYFSHIESELRAELMPINIPTPIRRWGEVLGTVNSVAIHVRRGDYLELEAVNYHGVLTPNYYESALRYIEERHPGTVAYVFSDDLDWAVSKMGFHCLSTSNRHLDMWLMGQCRHIITANSSFSWWAAFRGDWRKDRIVVCPGRWVKTDVLDMADIYRSHWVKLWQPDFFQS